MTEEIGKEFMKKTQLKYMKPTDQIKFLPQPPLELEYLGKKPIIDLPLPEEFKIKTITLREAIENRRSVRKYTNQLLTLRNYSYKKFI